MVGATLFLLAVAIPPMAFGLYMLRRGWRFARLIPYYTAYGVGMGLFLGVGFQLQGVRLLVAGGIGGLFALGSSLSWAWALMQMTRSGDPNIKGLQGWVDYLRGRGSDSDRKRQ